jgi:hypothetical protein
MKKLLFGLVATVMFGLVGNAQDVDQRYLSNSILNEIILKNGYSENVKVTKVTYSNKEAITKYQQLSNALDKQLQQNSFTFEIILNKAPVLLHVFLLQDGFTTLSILDKNENVVSDFITTKIEKNYDYSSGFNYAAKLKHDCSKGAAKVQAAGATIAFGGFFGCAPCTFVGAAIGLLGTIGAALCP